MTWQSEVIRAEERGREMCGQAEKGRGEGGEPRKYRGEKAKRAAEEKVEQASKEIKGLNTGLPQHGGKTCGERRRQTERRHRRKADVAVLRPGQGLIHCYSFWRTCCAAFALSAHWAESAIGAFLTLQIVESGIKNLTDESDDSKSGAWQVTVKLAMLVHCGAWAIGESLL